MVIVDSSVWIDAFNGQLTSQTAWLRRELGRVEIGITGLILCEVLRGFRVEQEYQLAKSRLLALTVYDGMNEELAIKSAENFRYLQRNGITVRTTVDCLIATFCIEDGHQLLHKDKDFDGFERHLGLAVVHA